MNTPPDPQRLLAAHAAATDFYRARLTEETRAIAYLHSRGIVAATAHSAPWSLGYAPRGWAHLRYHLREAGFTDEELIAGGLVTTARNGNIIDVFRDRVMFPIRDSDGQVVAFTGRDLSSRPNTPKYRNTTTTAVYQKKKLLYGLAEQLGGDTQPPAVMLVEGPADVVAVARLRRALGSAHVEQPYAAVAPCGTALTAEQVALLAAATPPGTPLIVAFDPDTAGQGAAYKSYQLLRGWPGPVDAIALPASDDPASLVARGKARAVVVLEEARVPLVDLVIDHRLARFRLDEIPGRVEALHATAPLVAEVAVTDPDRAGRLYAHLTATLDLNPLTVYEAIYPPHEPTGDLDPDGYGDGSPDAGSEAARRPAAAAPDGREAIALGAAGFPDPTLVGHEYARACPPQAPAATWVQHDPATGHSAWVIAEAAVDRPADRDAARLAAEVAGRVAVLVGAHKAVDIARTALNAHFAQLGRGAQGNATIAVLSSFDGEQPRPGRGQFTVAWAGDVRAYATTGRWFAALTVDHTLRGRAAQADPASPVRPGDGALTSSVRGGPIGVNRVDLPVTQIVLAGRALRDTDPDRLRDAVDGRRPGAAIATVTRLGGPDAVAMVVRPRPEQAHQAMTAARLARQDKAVTADPIPAPRPAAHGPRRAALPAAPAPHAQPVR